MTTDDLVLAITGIPFPTNTVTKTTDKFAGSFAAKLETKSVLPGQPAGPGVLIAGSHLNIRTGTLGGVPYTGRPSALQFRYKLTGANAANDSAYVQLFLTRTVAGRPVPIASADMYLRQPASTYTLINLPITYLSATATPDSLRLFISSGDADNLTAGTTLFIDDVTMVTGTTTATRDIIHSSEFTVFPNPSNDGLFTLEAAQKPTLLKSALTVTDVAGRTVLTQPAPASPLSSRTVDLRGRPAGVYTLRMATDEGTLVRRLVVR
jgi:hypothetical protein